MGSAVHFVGAGAFRQSIHARRALSARLSFCLYRVGGKLLQLTPRSRQTQPFVEGVPGRQAVHSHTSRNQAKNACSFPPLLHTSSREELGPRNAETRRKPRVGGRTDAPTLSMEKHEHGSRDANIMCTYLRLQDYAASCP